VLPRPTRILHADADAFFAAVEQRDDPALRGRPVIVGGGVVMAASYEARAYGVRSAMGGGRARLLCPDAVVVRPRWDAYVAASEEIFSILRRQFGVVERASMEEAFVDASGLEADARELGVRLRREVRERVGLAITVGVASTKVLAKLAGRQAKPDGLLVVEPGRELAFLHPLPVERVWGIGPATARRLRAAGLHTVGQVARLSEAELMALAGKAAGRYAYAVARNRDARPVEPGRPRRTFGSQSALGRRPRTGEEVDEILTRVVERVAGRMERAGRTGRSVVLRLRFGDYSRVTRSRTLPAATADAATILAAARGLLAAAAPLIERHGLTLVGITIGDLHEAGQLALALDTASAAALTPAVVEPQLSPGRRGA
jgi:DNA polymerase-4